MRLFLLIDAISFSSMSDTVHMEMMKNYFILVKYFKYYFRKHAHHGQAPAYKRR